MRVAFLSRDRTTHPGGDLIQIDNTIEALRKYDIEAVYLPDNASLAGFDLVHIFHINFTWSKINICKAQKAGIPYVVTPIFYPTSELGVNFREQTILLSGAKCVMPFSNREALEMKFSTLGVPVTVIPNGTDKMFYGEESVKGRAGVLCVAARGEDKNTGLVRLVCEELGLPFTMATGLGQKELAEVYKSHLVFVNASESERMSLTIGEALCSGCKVLATTENWGNEWYGQGLKLISPWNTTHLKEAVKQAYYDPEWDYYPNWRAKQWTWSMVAGALEQAYKGALSV